ncbi:IS1 family transposase [Photobacterium carnosum]|uniref:IS1 family transposase n=1 Tax=Photobacterium carnosum TaxID=2023717 RepID=UPI00399CEE76
MNSDHVKRKVQCNVFGRRTKAALNRLLTLLGHASICYFMTDVWPVYLSVLPAEKYIVGKRWIQRIERYNLNLRTHIKRLNRKIICFSKSPEMHDKVIGWYLIIHHYQ